MTEETSPDPQLAQGGKRWLYISLGWGFFALGVVGAVLPVLPTTPFMLLALWAFSRSSRRFEKWLLNHKIFGPGIRRWREHRVVPLSAKLMSLTAMLVTFGLSVASAKIPWWGLLGQGLLMGYGAWFVWRCPSRVPQKESS